jgi:hypothetical protein
MMMQVYRVGLVILDQREANQRSFAQTRDGNFDRMIGLR